jgi:hypothetical protein
MVKLSLQNLYYKYLNIEENWLRFKDRVKIFLSYWKATKKMYDFDYTGVLYAQLHQLRRLLNDIKTNHHYLNWEVDVYWLSLACKILDMYLEENWYTLNGTDGPIEDWTYTLPYVNSSNYARFIRYREYVDDPNVKIELYSEKLWNLFHNIMKYKLKNWWN